MPIEIGSKAPDFTLMNQDRQPVTLSAALRTAGGAGVFSCRVQLGVPERDVHVSRLDRASWAQRSAQVFGVSTDTFFTLKAWARSAAVRVSAAERLQQGRHPTVRRRQSRHDRPEGHRQAGGVRHRSRRASFGTGRCWTTRGTSRITTRFGARIWPTPLGRAAQS